MTRLKTLIRQLKTEKVLVSSAIEKALISVDRKHFVSASNVKNAYKDHPLHIGSGQTISQPSTVVYMLENLHIHSGQHILDIGSGSGWTTALLAYLVGKSGTVMGLERQPDLITLGQLNIKKYGFKNACIQAAETNLGLPGRKFDRILVSAAAETLPEALLSQLTDTGTCVIPVQNKLVQIKKEKTYIKTILPGSFRFVPLIS